MKKLTIIDLEYNEWNGFVFTFLGIDIQGKEKGFEGALFGIHFSKDHFIIEFAFTHFIVKSPIL